MLSGVVFARERALRCGTDCLPHNVVPVVTNAELEKGVPVFLAQEVFVHHRDHVLHGALHNQVMSQLSG
jgi:hypothetical protein